MTARPLLSLLVFALTLVGGGSAMAAPESCDPPGPPPRFGCQWSTTSCEWQCPVCDPFGAPPRSSCHWDGQVCNWICPGYTGVDVTVQTVQPPAQDATVYVRLSSLCRQTGALASCSGSFPVHPGTTTAGKCQMIVNTIAGDCSAAGYTVTANDCAGSGTFTASNTGCPGTEFALGLSNSQGTFDQTANGPMPDGESDVITGRSAPVPGLTVLGSGLTALLIGVAAMWRAMRQG